MTDHALTFTTALRGLDPDAWAAALEEVTEAHGSFTPLGRDHMATFLDAGPKLLVTFENAAEVRALPDAAPRGFAFARREGWSHLGIISTGESWFRDVAIYRHIDRLIDDGFFEDFEDVLFFGAQAGGTGPPPTASRHRGRACWPCARRPRWRRGSPHGIRDSSATGGTASRTATAMRRT